METKKELLLNLINESQGIKAVDLVSQFIARCYDVGFDINKDSYYDIILELKQEKKITVISYCLESMDYREKQFILPNCTKIITEWVWLTRNESETLVSIMSFEEFEELSREAILLSQEIES